MVGWAEPGYLDQPVKLFQVGETVLAKVSTEDTLAK